MRVARHTSSVAFFSFVMLLCLVEMWVVRSGGFSPHADVLALAVTLDLTLGIPLVYYLLQVRRRRRPAVTVAPVFIVAIVLAHLILPAAWQMYLERIEYLLPLVEGAALVYGVFKARAVIRQYRHVRPTVVYASDAVAASLRQTFGSSPLLPLLVTELSIPYYVMFGWFRSYKPMHPTHVAISCYRKSGYGAVLAMFAGLIVLETMGLHLLVQQWSATAAWVLTGLSIYSLVWIIGDYHAVRLHPLVLGPHRLSIRTGLRWRVDVDWTNIAAVHRAARGLQRAPGYLNMAVYDEPRLVLQLKAPITVDGLFGIKKQVRQIGLTVDDEPLFQQEIHRRIGEQS